MPSTEDFKAREIRDSATEVPVGYKPPDIKIAAMLHTKPRVTWDADDDDDRKRLLSRRPTKDQLREDDFKARSSAFAEAVLGSNVDARCLP